MKHPIEAVTAKQALDIFLRSVTDNDVSPDIKQDIRQTHGMKLAAKISTPVFALSI